MLKQFKHKRFNKKAMTLLQVIGQWCILEQRSIVPIGKAYDNINCRPFCTCT